MEAQEGGAVSSAGGGGSGGGVTVVGSDAPTDYHIAPRTETISYVPGSAPPASVQAGAMVALPGLLVKKKRGRPRKYAPDGSLNALSPKPISSSAPPPVIDFSGEKQHFHVAKQPKPRPVTATVIKQHKPNYETDHKLGKRNMSNMACSVGANFTPHIITVNAGEDVMMKVISFSQQGPQAICILSAIGVISSVTLRQPDSSGGTLTYEGRFEILSLTGSFTPSEIGGIRNRSGGMSVSLASPDGRVVGGGVAGLLVAASPVQIVLGSFLAGNEHEQKAKKAKPDNIITSTASMIVPISSYGGAQDHHYGGAPNHNSSGTAKAHQGPTTISFHGDSWSSMPPQSNNNNNHESHHGS
ncbi:uncharacterized protein [Phyllobates terribilis]|uniref:uncharacterized protein n=1 Tax=Phyllobates terribilis TaxID=111132 RepID=UPI003CCB22D3